METVSVACLVIAAGYGMLAVARSRNFRHPGNWFGVLAVLTLAWRALPSPKQAPADPPKHEQHSLLTPAVVEALARYEELRNDAE